MTKPATSKFALETGMLAFSRSIQISEGLFFGTSVKEGVKHLVPVQVLEKGVRGQSAEANAKNPGLSNPQSVESAVVPQGCDGIDLTFSVRVMPFSVKPHSCNNVDVVASYIQLTDAYDRVGGYRTLALLYAWNLANARFAWRNRFQTDSSIVRIEAAGVTLEFDPAMLSLSTAPTEAELAAALKTGNATYLSQFIDGIARGLSKGTYAFQVTWSAKVVAGQEIFPSQEYVRKDRVISDLSRVYAKLPTTYRGEIIQQASMHSQKIGAAIRHIDIWHGDVDAGAISVNPYGGVQETSAVLRHHSTKRSFYDIRKQGEKILQQIQGAGKADKLDGDIHFLIANLVRGGVFGVKGEA